MRREALLAEPRAAQIAAWGLLAIAAVLLVMWLPGIGDRFGPSYEGYTGAVWGSAVEAVEDYGWLESRGGTVRRDEVYANHPPGLTVALWGSVSVLGDGHWQMRSVAVIASLGALWLLFVLCRQLGASPGAAVAGVAVAGLSPMLVGYGSMVDTWVVGFPFGVVVLLTLADRRAGGWRAAAAVVCCLCSWQGVILAGLALPVAVRRFGVRSRFVHGLAGGIVGAWLFTRWAGAPSDGFSIGWPFDGASLDRLASMLGLGLVLAPLSLLARDRAVAAVAIGAPVVYGVLFSFHADWHDYWLLWLLAPVAVGTSVLAGQYGVVGRAWVACALVLGVVASAPPDRRGHDADRVASAVEGVDQPWLPIIDGNDDMVDEADWVGYETGLPARTVELEQVPAGWAFLLLQGEVPRCRPVAGTISLCR